MKAYRKWAEKPITRGNYVTLCAWCYAAALLFYGAWYAYISEPAWWTRLKSLPKRIKYSVRQMLGK